MTVFNDPIQECRTCQAAGFRPVGWWGGPSLLMPDERLQVHIFRKHVTELFFTTDLPISSYQSFAGFCRDVSEMLARRVGL